MSQRKETMPTNSPTVSIVILEAMIVTWPSLSQGALSPDPALAEFAIGTRLLLG